MAANEQPATESSSVSMTSETSVVASGVAADSNDVTTIVESVNQRKRRNRQERVSAEFERKDGPHMIMQTASRIKKPSKEQIAKTQNAQKIAKHGPSSSTNSSETSSGLEL